MVDTRKKLEQIVRFHDIGNRSGTAIHKDTFKILEERVHKTGWTLQEVEMIILLYLSSREDATRETEKQTNRVTRSWKEEQKIQKPSSNLEEKFWLSLIFTLSMILILVEGYNGAYSVTTTGTHHFSLKYLFMKANGISHARVAKVWTGKSIVGNVRYWELMNETSKEESHTNFV